MNDYLDYKCLKRGVITELVVISKVRKMWIEKKLIWYIEEYFKSENCEYSLAYVFAYNKSAISFYNKEDYHHRMHTDIKKLI